MNLLKLLRSKAIKKENVVKYLLYALGEIILIVLGIMIALKINENRQFNADIKLEESILEDLRVDLTHDLKELRRDSMWHSFSFSEMQYLLSNLRSSKITSGMTGGKFRRGIDSFNLGFLRSRD